LKILHVIADPLAPDNAVNKRVARAFFNTLNEIAPEIDVDTYDLYAAPPPFINSPIIQFLWYPPGAGGFEPTPEDHSASQFIREQCARLVAADILVLTAPVWNYGVPAIMKAWIDIMIAPNHTFRIGPGGPEPLHRVREFFIFLSSGGTLSRHNARDGLINQLSAAFEYIGITEPRIVWADGQDPALHPDYQQREQAALKQAELLAREIARRAR
jgi:FMN-dependent NADH-azoreductase